MLHLHIMGNVYSGALPVMINKIMAHTTTADTQRGSEGASSVDSAIGWIIAAVVLVAIIVGGFFLLRNGGGATAPDTNMEMTLPSGSGAGGASGGTGDTGVTGTVTGSAGY